MCLNLLFVETTILSIDLTLRFILRDGNGYLTPKIRWVFTILRHEYGSIYKSIGRDATQIIHESINMLNFCGLLSQSKIFYFGM